MTGYPRIVVLIDAPAGVTAHNHVSSPVTPSPYGSRPIEEAPGRGHEASASAKDGGAGGAPAAPAPTATGTRIVHEGPNPVTAHGT